jgi:hypothetical protein
MDTYPGSSQPKDDETSSIVQTFIYGNPKGARLPALGDPGALLNPSNQGHNPRVVDAAQGKDATFALRNTGAQLYYGNGQPMVTARGGLVMAKDAVFLNYGMRKDRNGQTFFMAWRTNRNLPESQGGESTGWVCASDMADDGAAALAAIPYRLANVRQPLAMEANGGSMTFVVNGNNQNAVHAVELDLKYKGFHGNTDSIKNFLNLHDGNNGIQMLVNLTNVPGGGIAEDCLPNGTTFVAAADAENNLIVVTVPVFDKNREQRTLAFIYGNSLDTWGWVVKDWLDAGA